jgi:hypothetical protein
MMIKSAVITGGHHFDVVAFHHLFRELPGIDAYVQHMADFVTSTPASRALYDALVFYTYLKGELANLGAPPGQDDSVRSVLESLGNTSQGIVILHHSLLAFPEWAFWGDVVGMADRTLAQYAHDEAIQVHIADPDHPVTAGLADWTITDETYLMPDAAGDNHILLTTHHPHSMTTLAWTRQHRASRVCCIQLGHDQQSWNDGNFRRLLTQAIMWCAQQS